MTRVIQVFHRLTSASLAELAGELDAGSLARGPSAHALQQIAGASLAPDLAESLEQLTSQGWATQQIAALAMTIREAREQAANPEGLFDVVLTGPDVPGVPTRDTAAAMTSLVAEARNEVLLVGYAVYNAKKIFERLATKMREEPQLKVQFLLNIQRRYNDTSLESEIVHRFAMDFVTKHWPWAPRPDMYYDPRSLEVGATKRASLHAKCVVVDRRTAMITSANFTEAAHERNIEAGVIVNYAPFVQRIADYFTALRDSVLKPCPLPATIQ